MLLIVMDRRNVYNEAIQVCEALRDHKYIQKFQYPEVITFEDVIKRQHEIEKKVTAIVEVYDEWHVHVCDEKTFHARMDNDMLVYLAQRAGSLYLADCDFPNGGESFPDDMATGDVFTIEAHLPETRRKEVI